MLFVAMEKAELLLAGSRVIGGVQVEDDGLSGGRHDFKVQVKRPVREPAQVISWNLVFEVG